MNYRRIANIALKIISINVFVRMTLYLPGVIQSLLRNDPSMPDPGLEVVAYTMPIIILFVLSLLIWIFSDKISNMMVKEDKEEYTINIDYNKVQQVAFSTLGVYLIGISLPTLITTVFRIYQVPSTGMGLTRNISMYYTMLISDITRVIFGIILVFGGKGLSNIINKVRKLD